MDMAEVSPQYKEQLDRLAELLVTPERVQRLGQVAIEYPDLPETKIMYLWGHREA